MDAAVVFWGRRHQRSDRPVLVHPRDLVRAVAEPTEDLVGVLAEQWRTLHLDRRVGKIDRRADLDIAAASRMIDLDQHAALVERLVLVDVFHRQDRAARHIDLVQRRHDLEFGFRHRPFLDDREAFGDLRQPSLWRRETGIGDQFLAAAQFHQRFPARRLNDHIDIVLGPPGAQRKAAPGWPPPEALPARGTASPNSLFGYSLSRPFMIRCWSRILTRHRLSTASVIATSTRWPLPVRSR